MGVSCFKILFVVGYKVLDAAICVLIESSVRWLLGLTELGDFPGALVYFVVDNQHVASLVFDIVSNILS